HHIIRRTSAQIGPPRLWRIATSKRITQKIEFLFRHPADPRLRLVYRQLQPVHDVPHRRKYIFCTPATADHQVISIIDDIRTETLLVSQLLPAEHEPAHVQIAEQGTDRRPLRCTPTLIPVARTPMLFPRSSVSSTGASSHILIRCSIAPS